MSVHRIAAISFRAAVLDCTCGAEVRGDRDAPYRPAQNGGQITAISGTPDALAAAWLAHRAAVGAGKAEASKIAYDPDHEGALHATSAGTSHLSAAERGRMGAAAKAAKKSDHGPGFVISAKHQRVVL